MQFTTALSFLTFYIYATTTAALAAPPLSTLAVLYNDDNPDLNDTFTPVLTALEARLHADTSVLADNLTSSQLVNSTTDILPPDPCTIPNMLGGKIRFSSYTISPWPGEMTFALFSAFNAALAHYPPHHLDPIGSTQSYQFEHATLVLEPTPQMNWQDWQINLVQGVQHFRLNSSLNITFSFEISDQYGQTIGRGSLRTTSLDLNITPTSALTDLGPQPKLDTYTADHINSSNLANYTVNFLPPTDPYILPTGAGGNVAFSSFALSQWGDNMSSALIFAAGVAGTYPLQDPVVGLTYSRGHATFTLLNPSPHLTYGVLDAALANAVLYFSLILFHNVTFSYEITDAVGQIIGHGSLATA